MTRMESARQVKPSAAEKSALELLKKDQKLD